jgi:DNA-binding HxlR family transcriptional regulator
MRSYGQYCPIARGSEILAERWTPIILRNVLQGCHTFNEIAAGAPGIPRALLTARLRELQRTGILAARPKPGGKGSFYEATDAGRDAWEVLKALGTWGDRWTDIEPTHADPTAVLWSWTHTYMRRELLPPDRIVVRFDFRNAKGKLAKEWFLVEHGDVELCVFDPGFGDDVVVTIHDAVVFARWHLGLADWGWALRHGAIELSGRSDVRRALPTWDGAPDFHRARRAAERAAL